MKFFRKPWTYTHRPICYWRWAPGPASHIPDVESSGCGAGAGSRGKFEDKQQKWSSSSSLWWHLKEEEEMLVVVTRPIALCVRRAKEEEEEEQRPVPRN